MRASRGSETELFSAWAEGVSHKSGLPLQKLNESIEHRLAVLRSCGLTESRAPSGKGYRLVEHPLALQLGGSDPAELAECAAIAEAWGYDEVNLNVGCPSDRVQNNLIGACLMGYPDKVADAVAAMRGAVSIPVTVKCRIGIDDQDEDADKDKKRRR